MGEGAISGGVIAIMEHDGREQELVEEVLVRQYEEWGVIQLVQEDVAM